MFLKEDFGFGAVVVCFLKAGDVVLIQEFGSQASLFVESPCCVGKECVRVPCCDFCVDEVVR